MVFQGQLANNTGPHLIPPDWQGVAYGRFHGQQTINMMRSLLSGPDVAARWAQVDSDAGLTVRLPSLEVALAKVREPVMVTVSAGPAESNGHTSFSALPVEVASAVAACCSALSVDVPESVTAKELRDLSQRARRLVENRKGVTDVERDGMAANREAIRRYTNPDT